MLFLGDSFTWGEGLELYMNKEPFISMRNQKATDIELRDISDYKDTEVEEWRSSKRFSSYVDGFEKYVQPNNGGSFHSIARDANLLTEKYNFSKKDIIVIQIPPADRSYFHMNTFTSNDIEFEPYQSMDWDTVQNIFSNEDIDTSAKIMGYDSVSEFVNNCNEVFNKLAWRNTKLFYYSYVFDLMQRFDVYFIGPWGYDHYYGFSKCDEFKDKVIPMVYNDNEYDSMYNLDKAMAKDGQLFEIAKEFKSTHNNHPTPLAHKIIGESINTFFSKNNC